MKTINEYLDGTSFSKALESALGSAAGWMLRDVRATYSYPVWSNARWGPERMEGSYWTVEVTGCSMPLAGGACGETRTVRLTVEAAPPEGIPTETLSAWTTIGDERRDALQSEHAVVRDFSGDYEARREAQDASERRISGRGRPPREDQSATSNIHLRVTPDRKSAYVKAAQAGEESLSDWMTRHCDLAAGLKQEP